MSYFLKHTPCKLSVLVTCAAVLLCSHRSGIELLQFPVQLLQFTARGLELALHLSRALAIGDGPPHSLSRLLDFQLPLDLLPEQSTCILQTLLKLWVENIALIQILQALKDRPQLLQSCVTVMLYTLYFVICMCITCYISIL